MKMVIMTQCHNQGLLESHKTSKSTDFFFVLVFTFVFFHRKLYNPLKVTAWTNVAVKIRHYVVNA